MVLQFTLPPQEGRRSKAMASNYPGDSRVRVDERRGKGEREGGVFFTWRGLVRAGEEEEDGALPTASDEGQAEPCDSSLWCCSGDRLSLLLSSSNAYESSCFGNLPWFTGGTTKREMGEAVSRPRQNRYREGFHMISPAHYNLSPLLCLLC